MLNSGVDLSLNQKSLMNSYQLAKLISWAGTLHTRKKLQKVVYMLQQAGCPLDAEFYLHHYGPYSDEVAQLTDQMVQQKLLEEREENGTYSYAISPSVSQRLSSLESKPNGMEMLEMMKPHEALAKELLKHKVKDLEYASTILYFYRRNSDWADAVQKAVKMKGQEAETGLDLARKTIEAA